MKAPITILFTALTTCCLCFSANAQIVQPMPGVSVTSTGVSAASASGSLISLETPKLHRLPQPYQSLDDDIALSYFDNTTSPISFGVATIGPYTVYALGERMTLPTATGFVDSLTLTFTQATGDSVAVELFPDTLYMGQYHLINILDPNVTPYAVTWFPASLINGPTNITIRYKGVAVPQNFFVVVAANVNTAQHAITSSFSLEGDSKPVVARTTDNAHSAFLAFQGVTPTTSLFDSTFLDASSQPIYSDWYVTTYVQTADADVAINSGNSNGLSIFPNPAVSHISISTPSGSENATIELRDMLGRVAVQPEHGSQQSLDVSQLQPGRYEAIVHSASGVTTAPVIIQR